MQVCGYFIYGIINYSKELILEDSRNLHRESGHKSIFCQKFSSNGGVVETASIQVIQGSLDERMGVTLRHEMVDDNPVLILNR